MKYLDLHNLYAHLPDIKKDYQSKKPFRYVMFENFFPADIAEQVLQEYPSVKDGKWDGTTYIDQKNKFQKRKFEYGSVMDTVFKELNAQPFLDWLQELSEIEAPLTGDAELFGGGLHQSTTTWITISIRRQSTTGGSTYWFI